jgi:cytochrome c5
MKMPLKTMITLAALSLSTQLVAGEQNNAAAGAETNNEAKALFENHCLACHQPHKGGKGKHSQNKSGGDKQARSDGAHPKRLAPPMAMVKKHYLKTYPEREQFIEKVSAWVKAPDANAAMLHHAVEKFGVMPPQAIDASTRQQIAGYIYDVLPSGHGKKGGCKKGEKH